MQLIILRGLPGCGKSVIADKLGLYFNNEVVHGDNFKLRYLENNSDFKKALEFSYDKIFKKIKELFENGSEIIVVEELFNNKNLIDKIYNFCKEKEIEIKSFYVKRDLEKLLEVENNRNRKIKNTKKDFEKLEYEIKEIGIENEIIIDNNGTIESSVEIILEKISK
ncbi:MAG: AAA family ATPase [Candidatus Pacebacteria bacterium]|nr:AAA family ATPase [Candidatus Paceibacterota bacterium]